jgi:hypothetical protein
MIARPLGRIMELDETATYERAIRLANIAVFTVDLQCRRLNSDEPEDGEFIFRKWADFHFLVVALTRLRRAAELDVKVKSIKSNIRAALQEFDSAIPNLR